MNDLDVMSRTLYGEVRGEYKRYGLAPFIAVANVINNRCQQQTWYGKTIKDVCLKPYQFSCWNEGDPNRLIVEQVTDLDPLFKLSKVVCKKVLDADFPDLTNGADHYHNTSVYPKWACDKKAVVTIGNHIFYK